MKAFRNIFSPFRISQLTPASFAWMLILLGALVRLYHFGDIPAGLHQDEASLSYDAYSVLTTGYDRNGYYWPIMFGAYGSGMSGSLAGYLSIPFLWLWGLTPVATRSVNLIFGLISLPVWYLLLRKRTTPRTALISLFLLVISPWFIMASRWGLDCNLFPPLVLIGTALFVAASEKKRFLCLLAFSVFGLALYSYAVSYVFLPLYLLLASLYFHRIGKLSFRTLLWSWLIFLLFAVPVVVLILVNHFDIPSIVTPFFTIPDFVLQPRYQTALNASRYRGIGAVVSNLSTLFQQLVFQKDGWVESSVDGYGYGYLFSFPLAVIGFVVSCIQSIKSRGKTVPEMIFILWFVAGVCTVSVLDPVFHRINILFLPLVFFAAAGASVIWKWYRLAGALLIFIYCLSFFSFLFTYFTFYAQLISYRYSFTYDAIIRSVTEDVPGTICITDQNFIMPEIRTLYALRYSPLVFADEVEYAKKNSFYLHVKHFGRFFFHVPSCPSEGVQAYIVQRGELPEEKRIGYTKSMFGNFEVWIDASLP